MNKSRPDDSEYPALAELVIAEGADELRFHVRDDEAAVAQLPYSPLASVECSDATRVELAIYPVTLRIPHLPPGEPMDDVPGDGRWQGWRWAANEFLLVHVDRDPNLPRLALVTVPRAGLCRLDVLGHPMRIWRAAPGNAGWAADAYLAEVHGFLDDATGFSAQIVAPTAVRREQLLAAVATLEQLSSHR